MSVNLASLIGRTLTIEGITVIVKEKIGEGGYAWVFRVEDSQGNQYALKFVNCLTSDRYQQFCQEAKILKSIPPNPNIVKLYGADLNPKTLIIMLLYEYCPATAIGILSKREMTREEILIFFTACAEATAFLHSQNPPIIHRDLKPENLLVATDGTPKLSDFGSATTTIYKIKNVNEINAASEDIERNTTQNYRSPEMIDLYKRVEIGTPADVWALGCTLYKLIYRVDLYKPEERLPILQGKLRLPKDADESFAMLISQCIQVDPAKRPTAAAIAGTAKMLRGPKDKIEIPKQPPKTAETVKGTPKPKAQNKEESGNWSWLNPINYVKEQYRSISSTGIIQWAIKSTFASNDPPETKYVRRVILASIRRTEMSGMALIDFILTQRPWKDDIRIAAKSLYLILLLLQYETSLVSFTPITVSTDKIMAYYSNRPDVKNKIMIEVVTQLGTILRTKVMLHAAHEELEGNLSHGDKILSENVENDLSRYLATINISGAKLIQTIRASNDFCVAVLSQPAIEEVSNAVKLLQCIKRDAGSEKVLENGKKVLNAAKKIPYLQTAVEFPEEGKVEPPFPRFVA
ncbi:CAMK family protein kinase [Histomonas meleagridis]|uniref:CAMK family protein kinase n=1 Tax=Histomonas meleagridis TaxID=135588 RepID=UPI00355A7559|nr:CAMK family protein kinase [Histomonas meleagridis]KAH0804790.1 CAMK family protein kinase [Histomonas meleagridis]